ncbi:MAG TPA: radical SAM family heme chaperone HemW [Gemmatimonadales bacterium]
MAHVYVHVPFCVRRCSYCDFSIAVRRQIPAREYVECILAEFRAWGLGPGHQGLSTLYFGGGTPSLLPPDALATVLTSLLDAFPSTPPLDAVEGTMPPLDAVEGTMPPLDAVEVTIEANPEDVTAEKATAWRRSGINRVSLGAQSFDDGVLRWMHRSHDAARIGEAVHVLRHAGIANISLDLIFGLPEELGRDWGRDLDSAVSLSPSHLSLYGLTVEERTPLARWVSRGATRPPTDDRYADEYLLAHERVAAAGLEFYEVSNASRPGFASRHNSAYWSGRPYLGLGPAAHSFDGHARRWNLSAWEAYRRAITEGRSPVDAEEVLTAEQRDMEQVYLALRTSVGLPVTAFTATTALTAWKGAGWVAVSDGRVVCTPPGWLRLDALVADLTGSRATT